MKRQLKHILQTVLVGVFVLVLSVTCWLKPSSAQSLTERRPLGQFPAVTWDSVFNAKGSASFMSQFESYTLDQFPLRDTLRTLKALSAYHLYGLSDNNGYFVKDGVISKLDYQIRDDSIDYATEKLQALYDKSISGKANNVFVSIIPDKSSLTSAEIGYPAMDNALFVKKVLEKMPYASYIDIMPLLSAEDYYATDTHWRQEAIRDVANTLATGMGTALPSEYTENTLDRPFYGVYYGQAAMPVAPDTLQWLTNDTIDALTAYNHGTGAAAPVYDMEKANGNDPYEIFLSGGKTAPITITNPNATTDKELIVFRDSFGSSIAPLLAQGYKTLTVIDLRETSYAMADRIVDFTDKDVLFLYSTLVLNNNVEGGERFK